MKTVLITGVAGFICSHVTKYFVRTYETTRFIGIDKLSYCSNMKNLEDIIQNPRFIFHQIDITDIESMQQLFEEYQPTEVIHLAAYTHVDASFGNSIEYTRNNVLGTHTLLEVVKGRELGKFLSMSTDEVYGSRDTLSDEYTILNPTNPYAATKAASDALVGAYYHSYKVPSIIIRCNNAYGTCQHPEKVIPRWCMRLLNGKKLEIQGSGKQLRSFVHVDDICRAIDCIYQKGVIGEVYNIGSKSEMSILELARIMLQKFQRDPSDVTFIEDRKFNDQRYHINYDKIEKLGWRQSVSFETGLEETIQWHREHPDYWEPETIAGLV